MPPATDHYRAFISYSHRDAKWAKWLHRALEQYHVPIDAYPQADKPKPNEEKRRRRLTPVFRDRDELPASGSLADTIQDALERSENLIVLCSPSSAASQYVNAEIEIFRGLRPENDQKVYALIIEGEPPDCFPAALTAGGAEPIAADARDSGDGKADAKLKLIAGMLGVGFDRLKQREAKRQRNRLMAMIAVVSTVAVMTSILALWALKAEREATEQKKLAEIQRELATDAKVVAEKQRELAVQSEKEATEAKNRAERQRELAEQAAREAKAVLGFFDTKVLAAARPKQQEGGLGIDATIRQAIDAAEPQIAKSFSDQPTVEATIRTTMGTSYWYLGDAKTAIPQLQRALALRLKKLGERAPETLQSMTILANSYQRIGRHGEALTMRVKTLALKQEVLGPQHIDTLTSASNLAVSFRGAQRFAEALALDEETLKLRKEALGSKHPDTISSMGSLASSYQFVGRHAEGLDLREKVLLLFKETLGPNHPDTLTAMQNVAHSYGIAGREEEAQTLHEKTLKLRREVQGSEHPDTLRAMYNVANTFINAGRWEDAVALHENTLELMIVAFGSDHRDTIGTRTSLAYAYWKSGRLTDSEQHYRILVAAEKNRDDSSFKYFYTQSLLGNVLTDMKKYAEAEPVLLDGYKGMQDTAQQNATGRSQLQFAALRLVTLYDAWDKPEAMANWQQQHDALQTP